MTIGLASIKETRPVGLAAPTRHHLLSSPVHFGPQQTNCCADGSKHAKTHGIPWFLHHLHQNSWDSWVFMPLKMGFNVLINNQMAVGWILSIRFGGHFRWFLGFKHRRWFVSKDLTNENDFRMTFEWWFSRQWWFNAVWCVLNGDMECNVWFSLYITCSVLGIVSTTLNKY